MNHLTNPLVKIGILKNDLDYHLIRASMVIIFLFFGYQKWIEYEAQALLPYISNGPLIFWMYPVFGVRGATYFLGVAEWLFGGLSFLGFWNKKLGILGALGACFSFIATFTIIPFMPGWLGCICGGLPCHDRKSCVSDEGSRSVRGVVLSVKGRRRESGAVEGSLCRISETTLPEDEPRRA